MKTNIKTLILVTVILTSCTLRAQVVEPVDKNKVANGGYDLVSYFTDSKAMKGNTSYTEKYKGVTYLFVTRDHQEAFRENPEKYLPVCNGYCAWGVAEKGSKVPVNPETFKIINGKLYLFFNGDYNGSPFNTLTEWNKNESALLDKLPSKWEEISN